MNAATIQGKDLFVTNENFRKMSTKCADAQVRETNARNDKERNMEQTRGCYFFSIWKQYAYTLGILRCYDFPIPASRMGSQKGSGGYQRLDELCKC